MTVSYRLDATRSRFTVQAFARGLLSMFGHDPIIAIRNFTGEMRFTPEAAEPVSLQLTVTADSLQVVDNAKPKDRPEIEATMRKEVLDSASFSEIRFQSIAVIATRIADNWYRLRIRGNLFLRGVTGTEQVDAQLRLTDDDMRLSGEGTLRQSAYRIKPVTALGGMITVKDEVKLSFDLMGRRADA
jgi:polyisoprenoid-binding protein YceI